MDAEEGQYAFPRGVIFLFHFQKRMGRIKRILLFLIFLNVAALFGCASVKVYDESTGEPVKNYEVTLKTLGEFDPIEAQFHIVRTVNKGKYEYEPEYYDILKGAVISATEAQRTMSLRMVVRILNPTGRKISLTYRTRYLTEENKGTWLTEDEVVYSGSELDIQRSIDCPMTIGQHVTSLLVYRGGFLLFEFADFQYKVEGE